MLALAIVLWAQPKAGHSGDVQSANPRLTPPSSRLNRSEVEAPFVCGYVAFGGTFDHDQGVPGYGAAVIFHPAAASGFLDFLWAWNAGLVLQADRLSLGHGGRELSADLIIRRYLRPRGDGPWPSLPFLGLGLGASSAQPGTGAAAPGLKYWSVVLEGGQEMHLSRQVLMLAKVQMRLLHKSGIDWSTWAIQTGIGLPFPW